MTENKKKKKFPVRGLLFAFFTIMAAVSIGIIVKELYEQKIEESAFEDLSTYAKQHSSSDTASVEKSEEEQNIEGYASLVELNEDYVGWISINDTKIDYPVMYTPNNPEYYLRRAFDKTSSNGGTLFVGNGANVDSDSFIIYGHNMKNGTMFADLTKYSDPEFFKEHRKVVFYVGDEAREYEVFAAMQTNLPYQEETGFQYYYRVGDLNEDQFNELMDHWSKYAAVKTEKMPEYGDQILTMSTCSYHTEDGRFVVVAHRTRDTEETIE